MSRQIASQPVEGDRRRLAGQVSPSASFCRAEEISLQQVVTQALADERLEPMDARLLLMIGLDPTTSIRALAERSRCQVRTARAGIDRLAGTDYLSVHRKTQGRRVLGTLYVVRGMRSTLPHQMELFGSHLPEKKKNPESTGPVEAALDRRVKSAKQDCNLSPTDRVRRRIQQAATKPGWSYAKAVPVIDAAIARVGLEQVERFSEGLQPQSLRPWDIERALRGLAVVIESATAPTDLGLFPAANDSHSSQLAQPTEVEPTFCADDPMVEVTCDNELRREAEYILQMDTAVSDMWRLKVAIELAGMRAPNDWRRKDLWLPCVTRALASGTLERPTKWLSRRVAS